MDNVVLNRDSQIYLRIGHQYPKEDSCDGISGRIA